MRHGFAVAFAIIRNYMQSRSSDPKLIYNCVEVINQRCCHQRSMHYKGFICLPTTWDGNTSIVPFFSPASSCLQGFYLFIWIKPFQKHTAEPLPSEVDSVCWQVLYVVLRVDRGCLGCNVLMNKSLITDCHLYYIVNSLCVSLFCKYDGGQNL